MKPILTAIIKQPQLHKKWLNTLSYLEFMGARKIARSSVTTTMDETRLKHLAEEARHAHFFKLMISRIDGKQLDSYNLDQLFCGIAAGRYFHSVDIMVKNTLVKKESKRSNLALKELCYLYVTTLVEERVCHVYPIYNDLLSKAGINIRLQSLIGEEDRHLADMEAALSKNPLHQKNILDDLRKIEQSLFETFYKRMLNHQDIQVQAA